MFAKSVQAGYMWLQMRPGAKAALKAYVVQVAEQQGVYLAGQLNSIEGAELVPTKPFTYKQAGTMASLGEQLSICASPTPTSLTIQI